MFSTIVDAFITPFQSESKHDRWRYEEYGRANFCPVAQLNKGRIETLEDAVSYLTLNRTDDRQYCIDHLVEVGVDKALAISLVDNWIRFWKEDIANHENEDKD